MRHDLCVALNCKRRQRSYMIKIAVGDGNCSKVARTAAQLGQAGRQVAT